MGKAITEAAEWLAQEPATDWGEHEWRLFNVVEEAEALEAENARLHSKMNFISGAVNWEINPNNYTHEEVCALNAQWIKIGNTARATLAEQEKDDGL